MAAFWRWDLVVLAGVVVSLASAQTPPILDDATGPRQIGGCSAGRSLAGVDVSERQNLETVAVGNEADCMDICLSDKNCNAAAYYRGVCYTKAMEVVNENVVPAPEDLTLLWCEDASEEECCLLGGCVFCPQESVQYLCIDKPGCAGFEFVDDSLCCKSGPPTLDDASGPGQIGGCSAGRSLAGADVSDRQNLGTRGVSSEAECLDFCLSDVNCNAAAYYRGVCYTKAMEVVNENVVPAPEDLTLLWCEDEGPPACVPVDRVCESPNRSLCSCDLYAFEDARDLVTLVFPPGPVFPPTPKFLSDQLSGNCRIVKAECIRQDCDPSEGGTFCGPQDCTAFLDDTVVTNGGSIIIAPPDVLTASDSIDIYIECEAPGGPWCPFQACVQVVS